MTSDDAKPEGPPPPFAIWMMQIRAPFLLLSVMLVLIGGAVAFQDEVFSGLRFALAMVGTILAHISVNLFNEFSDYRSKIDEDTTKTPFSGGTGNLQAGLTKPKAVLGAALGTGAVALAIGAYLSWLAGWWLMAFIGAGVLATVFYTSHLARWSLGELTAGACLGTFVVLGTYFAMAGTVNWEVVWLSVPPGILTALLLLLNEFPDVEADRKGGRRHLVIVLGYKGAAVVYLTALAAVYLILIAGVILRWFPPTVLIALLTLPLAIKASIGALRHGQDMEKLVPAMGANVGLVLGTDLLIAVAYFIPL
ncbi:MAG: prenyltransferase [Deltaproteobacteria bacterium]|nr:prenyltransferase [Deltaproteobacteria bacterium]